MLSIALSALLLATPVPDATSSWPQWRGPGSQGISNETGLPVEWSPTKNVRWKTEIPGRGHSSPIVWGNRVFLTTAIEGDLVPGAHAVKHMDEGKEFLHPDAMGADHKQTLKVLCLDADTGKLLWERTAWEGTPYDSRHKRASFASQTPVTDGERVYAFFGAQGLYAYDYDGKLLFKVDVGTLPNMGVGDGTSPVLWKDNLILLCDEDTGEKSFVAAFDKKTGKEAWRTPRKVQVNWSTPIVVNASGHDELIAGGFETIAAYDPATGKELWHSKGLESNAVPTPVAAGDIVVITSGSPSKIAMAIRPGGTGDITDTSRILWKYAKGTAYVPSPLFYGDYVYLMTDKGLITCLDAKTGEVKYEGARVPVPATFMASPVAYEGKILLPSEDGDTFVIKAGPVHEVLRTNSVGEPIYASPAISKGRIFIRGANHLFCIG
jgi:outer membrane protein assembly factor BamB